MLHVSKKAQEQIEREYKRNIKNTHITRQQFGSKTVVEGKS